jgi:hypothetical protein
MSFTGHNKSQEVGGAFNWGRWARDNDWSVISATASNTWFDAISFTPFQTLL